jgi:hypothetical protein
MKSLESIFKIALSLCIVFTLFQYSFSQNPGRPQPVEEDFTWWYLTLFFLVAGLAGTIYWKIKNKKPDVIIDDPKKKDKKDNSDLSFDADEEMEWLRKNQNIVDRKRRKAPKKQPTMNLPKTNTVLNGKPVENKVEHQVTLDDLNAIPLPVFDFKSLKPSKPFSKLSISNDEALISAIEQTHDEYEEDEEVRELAVRILAAFKTRNSIESLSQVAIYDLSSSLRSKAINILTEFDHESVFETILLGCADPTREVRAAAARGLTRLSFDRTDAWTRIIETNEEGRIRQAARAAIEGGFVERSFDRLIHRDEKHAYEAFVLLYLIVKSGELEGLIEAIKNQKDPRVSSAILHIFKVSKDANTLATLYKLIENNHLPEELKVEIDKTISEMNLVAV